MDTNETIDLLKALQIWLSTIDCRMYNSSNKAAFVTPSDFDDGQLILALVNERIESDSNKIQELLDNFMVELEI